MPDYLSNDPPPTGGTPASTQHVVLTSAGESLHGVLHLPPGDGPHPVTLLLHGFPGWERNFDIAQALRRAGVATLVFHYRGCWGMPGTWSWANALADTREVLAQLLSGELETSPGLDSTRVAVVGHSLGGFLALMAAAQEPAVRVTASIAGFDFGAVAAAIAADPALHHDYVEAFELETPVLTGTDGATLAREMQAAGQTWSLRALAADLADRDVLLIGTSCDPVTRAGIHHLPLVEAFSQGHIRLQHALFATDHSLSDHRVQLTRHVVSFVSQRL
ncbi:S9 family peptidase [Cellulomonas sp. Leaf334]|uniref:alpha/beta hydrolase family protein n=1 Tax=Cellulomonas sp. Leaf334 TaxID=1736339 RepID=UPI0007015E86|nr:alpha/beta fold hydrolase [Cellulomonas sp. Leaf334]KQR17222.1 hypothetical protein ASF78_07955 [Cellulomonas sp. Leaf334]